LVNPPLAEIAFFDDVVPRADKANIIRAGGHAVPAADTPVGVDHDDPILRSPVRGFNRANGGANGPLAMIAHYWQKGFPYIRVATFFDLLDPGPPTSQGDFIFSLASQRASVTADAFSKIDQHGIPFVCHWFPPFKINS
jgi:hypothetical protein